MSERSNEGQNIGNNAEGTITGGLKTCQSYTSIRTATPDSTVGIPLEKAPRPITQDPSIMKESHKFDSEGPGPALVDGELEDEKEFVAFPINSTKSKKATGRASASASIHDFFKGCLIGLGVAAAIIIVGYAMLDKNCSRAPDWHGGGWYDCKKGLVLEFHFLWKIFAAIYPERYANILAAYATGHDLATINASSATLTKL